MTCGIGRAGKDVFGTIRVVGEEHDAPNRGRPSEVWKYRRNLFTTNGNQAKIG